MKTGMSPAHVPSSSPTHALKNSQLSCDDHSFSSLTSLSPGEQPFPGGELAGAGPRSSDSAPGRRVALEARCQPTAPPRPRPGSCCRVSVVPVHPAHFQVGGSHQLCTPPTFQYAPCLVSERHSYKTSGIKTLNGCDHRHQRIRPGRLFWKVSSEHL